MPYVVSVTETFLNRSIKVSTDRVRDYVRTFDVVIGGTNARLASPDLVLTAIGVPRRWDFYYSAIGTVDLYSTCRDVEARQDTQDPYLWRITAHYSNKVDRPDISIAENPLLRPADISYTSLIVERPLIKDLKGVKITNSALDVYDPPPTYEEHILVMTVSRNQSAYNALFYLKYHGAVNSDTWNGLPPGRVKCAKIDGKRMFESGIYFWPTTYEFHIRFANNEDPGDNPPGVTDDTGGTVTQPPNPAPRLQEAEFAKKAWQLEILDRGYREQFTVNGAFQYKHMRDLFTGQPITSPELLDGRGKRLRKEERPVFRTHTFRRSLPFSALQIF